MTGGGAGTTDWRRAMRSSKEKRGDFLRFSATAIMISSKTESPLVNMSRWPYVTGSNVPG
jgi:hypothetical protein